MDGKKALVLVFLSRLEPVKAHVKNNKKGIGAEKKRKTTKPTDPAESKVVNDEEQTSRKKTKALSKRVRKMQEQEKQMQEKEFERAFFREFWPYNV
ncbi:G patch domain-containing protein 11-like isoform X2 [Hibiscus syriacus]|uniref:G patch domain-containing protein 11-like isoform X2 n=1 Tax=Hibiscus syriacus TaxID=106335 RepID=A0A6A3B9D3_HIBSY|nr:G patch domain-containing protein 11-like isoform X2 [Hibiscus syriacus]